MRGFGRFVAEVKIGSPFGFRSKLDYEELLKLAIQHGDSLSIHTDPRWGGSLYRIRNARYEAPDKAILAKGIHRTDEEIEQCLQAGADAVLVVGRIPREDLLPFCWLEPTSLTQLRTFPPDSTIVWNSRCLITGLPKVETLDAAWISWYGHGRGKFIQASMIKTPADVDPDVDGFIVGEHLPDFINLL